MAELPTPHSIAIGTLIALYADPNSPLVALDWDSNHVVPGEVDEYNIPQSTTEWSLRLMNLIRRLVAKEDEGVVELPNDEPFGLNDDDGGIGNNPADDDVSSKRDTKHEMMEILANDEYFFKKHALDGKDILDDVMGLFGSSIPPPSNDAADGQQKRQGKQSGRSSNSGGGSFDFRLETLSTLLDRIDDAFTSSSTPQRLKQRTLPSLALLSRLQMASTSVDDLMNLLDEWHALLEGSHVGMSKATGQSTIGIDGESTFGVYLRKLCLGMEEITFEALARLWDALREFVRGEVTKRNAKKDRTLEGEEQNLRNNASNWFLSSPQIERIVRKTCLEHSLDSLLCHRGDKNDGGDGNKPSNTSLSPANSPSKYMNLLETHPECPSLHFLLFLSSLANGQRAAALESLHRYFDYAMIHERKERAERSLMLQASEGEGMVTTASGSMMASGMGGITGGMTGGIISGAAVGGVQGAGQRGGGAGGAGGGNQPSGKVFKESNVMQYAAILMAQMYHRFGYTQLSLQATEEAVRVAQQSGDEECVCFANAWLALVSSSVGNGSSSRNRETSTGGIGGRHSVYASVGGFAYGSGVGVGYRPLAAAASSYALCSQEEEAMLHRCQTRAAERGLTSLAAGASLELARRTAHRRLGSGDDDMEDYGEGSTNASSLAWDGIQSAGRMPVAGSSSTGHGVRRPGTASGGGRTSALQAAPTNIYNMTPNEALNIHSRQNIGISGLWESTGHSSLASLSSCAALYGSGGHPGKEETTSSMMMNRVLSSFTIGPGMEVWRKDHEGQVAGESYALMLNHLASILESKRHSSEWISPASVILHEWSVRSYDFTIAQGLHTLLANHAAFSPGSDALSAVESSLMFLSQSTLLYLQRAEYDRAKIAARRACWLARRHGLMWHQAWSLLQLALIDLDALASALSTQPLPPLLECLSLCQQYSMDPLRAIALSTLSKTLLCMGRHHKAHAMLESALPLLMQHGSFWYQGEAFLTLAKCYLAEAASLREGEQQSKVEQGGSSGDSGGGIELSSAGKRKRSPQQQQDSEQQHDSISLELHETALSELKRAAVCFEKIEDICRLRQVYYLQARVFNALGMRKQREEAANVYSDLSVDKRVRMVDSVQTSKQWGNLWSCVLMKQQR